LLLPYNIMKIFVDENIPKITVRDIQKRYPDTKDIRGTMNEGIKDERIWETVKSENRLLITTDKGFSKYRYEKHPGIIIILLKQPTLEKIHQRVLKTLEEYSEKDWQNRIVIVRDNVKSTWCINK
jgi:predicted nuclease of predicted toxin-antitoxin system